MSRILLDTSAYRQVIRNHFQIQATLEKAEAIILNSVIIGEILCGFAKGSSPEKNREHLEDFLISRGVSMVPIDCETAESYAFIHAFLSKEGTPVSPNDLWIAASAMQHGLRVVTLDRDYLKIPQIMTDCFDPA